MLFDYLIYTFFRYFLVSQNVIAEYFRVVGVCVFRLNGSNTATTVSVNNLQTIDK